MAIPVTVPKDEIFETPIMPADTQVDMEISGVEVTESKNPDYKGAHNLQLTCDVIKAQNPQHVGISLMENICVPSQVLKEAMKPKSWSFVRDRWSRLTKIFRIKDPVNVDEGSFLMKRITAVIGVQEYQGKQQNFIKDILKVH